jgi:hypothetical protein
MMTNYRARRTALGWLAVASLAAGCETAPQGPPDLGPPGLEPSKAALVASLDAWKADRRETGVLIGSKPAIGIADAARTYRPLVDYEVVGPLMVIGKTRPFAVRLVLGEPRESVSTRYLVMGQDPLWVFRQEDFDRMLHWEHRMDGKTEPAAPPAEVR